MKKNIQTLIDKLSGKYINIYVMGVEEPFQAIVSHAEGDERHIKIHWKNGGLDNIPFDKVMPFLKGEIIILKDSKEPYGLELLKPLYEMGGTIESYNSPIITMGMQNEFTEWGSTATQSVFADGGKTSGKFDHLFEKYKDHLNKPKAGLGKYLKYLMTTDEDYRIPIRKEEVKKGFPVTYEYIDEFGVPRKADRSYYKVKSVSDDGNEVLVDNGQVFKWNGKEFYSDKLQTKLKRNVIGFAKGGNIEITNETIDRGGLGATQDNILERGGVIEVGDVIDFEYNYSGDSKLKSQGKVLSKSGSHYNVLITSGLMKGKTTDVDKSLIINKMAKGGQSEKFKIYHETLGSALDEMEEYFAKRGFTIGEFFPPVEHIPYETTWISSAPIMKQGDSKEVNTLMVQIYRLHTGRYELNFYTIKKMTNQKKYSLGGFVAGAIVGSGATYLLTKNENEKPIEKGDIQKQQSKDLTPKEDALLTFYYAVQKDGFIYAINEGFLQTEKIKDSKLTTLSKSLEKNAKALEKYIDANDPTDNQYGDEISTASALDKEGLEYGFLDGGYSDWKGVKDSKFQTLLKTAIKSYKDLLVHFKNKYGLKDLNDESIDEAIIFIEKDEFAKGGVVKKAKKIVRKTIKKAKPVAKKIVRSAKIGFKALAKKVAKAYQGKPVKTKYQKLYGKKYSKDEAQEVGDKVASKVYRQQQGR